MKIKRLNQSGAVALLTVSLFATIVTIIVIAYASSALSQQQASLNYDLSNRAYYAAESGVQDAVRALNAADPGDPNSLINQGQNTCKSASSSYLPTGSTGQLGNNLAYTCQLVTVNPTEVEGDTTKGSFLLPIKPRSVVPALNYTIKIAWSPKTEAGATTLVPRGSSSQLFPPLGQWKGAGNNGVHPLMRAEFVTSKVSNASRNDIKQQVYLLNPLGYSASREAPISVDPTADRNDYNSLASLVQDASCYPSDTGASYSGYSCQKSFTVSGNSFTGRLLYLRLSSMYGSTKFKITVEQGGATQQLDNAPPVIESTGRAGNVFRRIRQTMPSDNNTYATWPDGALAVGDGFCKLLQITNSSNQYSTGCTAEGLYQP